MSITPHAARRRLRARFAAEPLESRLLLATYTVTSTADAGAGTLRQAILNANSNAGADTIAFNISPSGVVHTISPTTLLPAITGQTTINGNTQPGYTPGRPLIELSGNLNPAGGNALMFQNASGSVVRALIINRFASHAVIFSGGSSMVMEGNWIGLDSTGTAAAPNRIGVLSNAGVSRFGGTTVEARNVVSGNTQYGLQLDGDDNVVTGNYVGTNAAGTAAVGNVIGVNFRGKRNRVGGAAAGERNVISGNTTGVRVGVEIAGAPEAGAVISGNYIGTRATGLGDLGNTDQGVWIMGGSTSTRVGGRLPGEGNIIAGNGVGILLTSTPPSAGSQPPDPINTRIEGNIIGLDLSLTRVTNDAGVSVTAGTNNVVGGTFAGMRNTISGNGYGVRIVGAATTGNRVEGNYIGLKPDGTGGAVNNSVGVSIEGAGNNTIGGSSAAERNVISNNFANGVSILSTPTLGPAAGNKIWGNYIGTDPTGTLDLGNGGGIEITDASGTLIGDGSAIRRNVISGNNGTGIRLTARNTLVHGNYIGTNAAGSAAIPNGTGVSVAGTSVPNSASDNTIGGAEPGEGNLISGNSTGVLISGINATNNVVQGNRIGTDANGTAAVANSSAGVLLRQTRGNTVGGPVLGSRNLVSGNLGDGVFIEHSTDVLVRDNYIGVTADGTAALGNGIAGVRIGVVASLGPAGDLRNTVSGNLISGNRFGVLIQDANANRLYRNTIGLNASGQAALPNINDGVQLAGVSLRNTIGGGSVGDNETENVIAGNNANGVVIGFAATDNLVRGNQIGYVSGGFGPPVFLGNRLNGLVVAGSNNRVIGNRFLFNGLVGILVTGGANNALLNNTMQNDGIGIDLGSDGVTPNDAGDGDSGANSLQNYPVITAIDSDDTQTTVSGTLNSRPNLSYEIQLFSTATLDPSGYGEGQTYLGSVVVTTDASGNAPFTARVASLPQGQWVTATATRTASNVPVETSEFSASVATPAVIGRGPRVTAVFVAGSAWAGAFMQHLQDVGRGDRTFGFAVPAGAGQLTPLPWVNVQKISIRFDEPVSVQQGDLVVRAAVGDGTRPTPQYTFASFNYDAPTRTATWVLRLAIRADRIQLDLEADGADAVKDLAGNTLDGEWTDGQSAFPSGDGNSGGDFLFRFNVVPADVTRNGAVNVLDEMQVRRRYGASLSASGVPTARYSAFGDLNADGRINALDVSLVRTRQRRVLP